MSKSFASTALTFIAAAGVIATAVLTAKDTPKARAVLNSAEREKGEKLTTLEKVKIAGPAYIPAIAVGASTIACIFGANVLNKRTQATLAGAYPLVDSAYREYRKKVDEIFGDGSDAIVETEVAKDHADDLNEFEEEQGELIFDMTTMKFFNSTIEKADLGDGTECYIITSPYESLLEFIP
jgi:Zn-dependent alcohol dehydrogenase